ncbi:hypothetical protein ANCCAN_26392 [Ancylostoma caninum]|uniref:Uncharacterized protein n=1 Tax=Ancylostoma caninum TaxID=29170 RepID=A0A368F732_ANCCA|nr:hypothetical protein ANCCAN_26392 [Ancylostoma caninum]
MVDLTVSGPAQPPACRNGTISGYTRRLIFFFFNLINNFNLMTGLVDFGCHFSRMSSGSRIVCLILNQQFPPPQV